jgi:hypothetical protein
MACDKISVQTNIQKAEEEQQIRIDTSKKEAELIAQQEDLIAEQKEDASAQDTEGSLIPLEDQQAMTTEGDNAPAIEDKKEDGLPWGWIAASVIGLGAVSYVGYKMYTSKENK